jgi:hypothetical protein
VLSLRKRFGGESAPLAWVRRSLVNHVIGLKSKINVVSK